MSESNFNLINLTYTVNYQLKARIIGGKYVFIFFLKIYSVVLFMYLCWFNL